MSELAAESDGKGGRFLLAREMLPTNIQEYTLRTDSVGVSRR